MTPPTKLKRNAAQCKKCNDIVESKFRHDFRQCKCGNIFVDGGLDYRRCGWDGNYEEALLDLCEYESNDNKTPRKV